ncbi:flagellar hook-associated protein 3 [Grimontia hollisae]|uniref:Flagellar hook-associated protein FlgL n=2 Tax=Grimontia hollisae TaxID=673 RepID=D0I432_GRIHO|nr:flagellar hook-associated protein FlgL [Grimontia hollisae]AUW37820.1 flagellar hook-associated protein 3 [Grimontia hollisae]EEY73810.1 flagellar hook-associated protein FlgL [Grimontia hollisae CIP 101886]MDF2183795.1 flagellar hook-associated protein FlgL [Grimontia hollisae]STO41923.1 Hook-filament junction protein [Grimontia hollisae]STO55847.1 Hook-filament junction protein [Grimontia hollisae]
MRLSSAQLNEMMFTSIQTSTAGVNRVLTEMGSQKKMLAASDDPLGAVQVMMLNREQSNIAQFQKNITNLEKQLTLTESHIDASNNALLRAEELVASVLNASNSDKTGREAIASELEGILDQLLSEANSQNPNGDYIFSGTKTDTPAVARDPDTGLYVFQGNQEQRMVSVAESTQIPANQTAHDLYFNGADDGSDIFNTLASVIDDLRDPAVTGDALTASVSRAQTHISAVREGMGQVLTDVGAQRASMDRIAGAHEDNALMNENLISDVEDLDYSEAILRLNTHMAALQATQMSYTKIQNLSLFKMM